VILTAYTKNIKSIIIRSNQCFHNYVAPIISTMHDFPGACYYVAQSLHDVAINYRNDDDLLCLWNLNFKIPKITFCF
jgi:hypothetical protein